MCVVQDRVDLYFMYIAVPSKELGGMDKVIVQPVIVVMVVKYSTSQHGVVE
jgi:hypothetical protein